MSEVVCKLPRAGLGNQLFPLMKAYTFGYLNKLPVTVIGYHQFKIGPYLRREKTKRRYRGFFVFQKNMLAERLDSLRVLNKKFEMIAEPPVHVMNEANATKKRYLFREIPHWDHYFDGLKEHRQLVIELFWKMLSGSVKKKIQALQSPCIGVHIRMGDFRKMHEGEDFSKLGIVRTPEQYFVDVINNIREIHGSVLPVHVFTDGYRHEFVELFKLENITMVEGNSDIIDLLLLSKSRIIVTSATSTFSYWSAFLSDAIVIMHPDQINIAIRPEYTNGKLYQGIADANNLQFVDSVRNIT